MHNSHRSMRRGRTVLLRRVVQCEVGATVLRVHQDKPVLCRLA